MMIDDSFLLFRPKWGQSVHKVHKHPFRVEFGQFYVFSKIVTCTSFFGAFIKFGLHFDIQSKIMDFLIFITMEEVKGWRGPRLYTPACVAVATD